MRIQNETVIKRFVELLALGAAMMIDASRANTDAPDRMGMESVAGEIRETVNNIVACQSPTHGKNSERNAIGSLNLAHLKLSWKSRG